MKYQFTAKTITVIFACLIGFNLLILLIDYDTKNKLLKAANDLKEVINDQRISAANNQGNHPNPNHNGHIPDDLVADGTGTVEKESNTSSPSATARTRKSTNQRSTRNNSSEIPATNE